VFNAADREGGTTTAVGFVQCDLEGEPDAGKPPVRFGKRGRETEAPAQTDATAPNLDFITTA